MNSKKKRRLIKLLDTSKRNEGYAVVIKNKIHKGGSIRRA